MSALRKSIVLSFYLATISIATHAQVIFTYGPKAVTKEEFLKAYNKNNAGEIPSDKSYRDYLELYSRFKIKVQAANDLRLDTLPNQKVELQGFRSQIIENYMSDDESMKALIDEAFERSQKDIHLAHIYVAIPPANRTADIQKAQLKINDAYSQLAKGAKFENVAINFSEDPSVTINKGDIGYITAFTLNYDLENLAYNTKPGTYSQPFRSKTGFHIFMNLGERKAAGRIRASQILLAITSEMGDLQKQEVKKKADSIYNVLVNGSDFKTLAAQFSNDNISFQNGGEMVEFGIGRYDKDFEAAAFALEKDSEISKPVRTEFGYHIIKRLERKPVQQSNSNAQWMENLKQQVMQSDRMETARTRFLKKIQKLTAFKKLPVNEKNLKILSDAQLEGKPTPKLADINSSTPIFSFAKQIIKVKDWQNYIQSVKSTGSVSGKTAANLYDQFVENTVFEYYREHLEQYNKEFSYQLKEFKDGNLLFEVMQRKIWDVAAADSNGLKNYYQQHKNNYWWEASADAIIFTAANEAEASKIKTRLDSNYKNWRKIVETGEGTIQGDSSRFELSQIPVAERTNFTEKLITANVKNESDNSVSFAYIIKIYRDREPRNFDDARGFVINDYQGFLEDKWITDLKKKYPVKINEAVVSSLSK